MTLPILTKAFFLVENNIELENVWRKQASKILKKKDARIDYSLIITILKIFKKQKQNGRLESLKLLNLLEKKIISLINIMDERDMIGIYNEFLEGELASIDFLDRMEEKLFIPLKQAESIEP